MNINTIFLYLVIIIITSYIIFHLYVDITKFINSLNTKRNKKLVDTLNEAELVNFKSFLIDDLKLFTNIITYEVYFYRINNSNTIKKYEYHIYVVTEENLKSVNLREIDILTYNQQEFKALISRFKKHKKTLDTVSKSIIKDCFGL